MLLSLVTLLLIQLLLHESDTTISVTVSITSYMTGFDGKPNHLQLLMLFQYHSMPSTQLIHHLVFQLLILMKMVHLLLLVVNPFLFGLIVSMVVLFM